MELTNGNEARAALIANDLGARVSPLELDALKANLEQAEKTGSTALVTIFQREIDAREGQSDDQKSQSWSITGIKLFAKSQGIVNAVRYDKGQEAVVMTPEMRGTVSNFQKRHGLSQQSGVLDYQTLSKAAGVPIGSYLQGAH